MNTAVIPSTHFIHFFQVLDKDAQIDHLKTDTHATMKIGVFMCEKLNAVVLVFKYKNIEYDTKWENFEVSNFL